MNNNAYHTMKSFWLDVKNLQHKKEVPALGEYHICVAGVEMAALDDKGVVKNLLIAASSLGNCSVYFENNSPSGIGGFTGGTNSGPIHEKAQLLLKAAADTAGKLPVVEKLPLQQNPENITLFTVSTQGEIRAQQIKESQAHTPANPLYAFFAYTQQLFGAFRAEQETVRDYTTAKPRSNTPQ